MTTAKPRAIVHVGNDITAPVPDRALTAVLEEPLRRFHSLRSARLKGIRVRWGKTVPVVRYGRLNAWAEREQRRFDEQRAKPHVPGTEPTSVRVLQAFLGTLVMATRFLVFLPLCIVWVIALIAQHTVSSLVLAVVLVMLGSISAFTTSVVIRARRARGANWFTGLAPKVRSN
jgi:hypothetical protein